MQSFKVELTGKTAQHCGKNTGPYSITLKKPWCSLYAGSAADEVMSPFRRWMRGQTGPPTACLGINPMVVTFQ